MGTMRCKRKRDANAIHRGMVRTLDTGRLMGAHDNQLLITNRSRQRAPNLTSLDRFILGLTTLLVNPGRIVKLAVAVK